MPKKNKATLLQEAHNILKIVNGTKVDNSRYNLGAVRDLATNYVIQANMIAPAMTAATAITLLGMGLCQELTQRFLVEYLLKYRSKDIALIMLSNTEVGHTSHDHMFIQLHPMNVPTKINICRENGPLPELAKKEDSIRIEDYFRENAGSIFADPLLNCAGDNEHELEAFTDYCGKYNQTHVVGVRIYDKVDPVNFAENIMQNAITCSNHLKKLLTLATQKAPHPPLSAAAASTRKIIEFSAGPSTNDHSPNTESQPVIYYDHAEIESAPIYQAITTTRKINLNNIKQEANGAQLAYQALLAEDLSSPVDIFMTRVLGHLTPEAVNLLMFALIDLMQPDSTLYLEMVDGEKIPPKEQETAYPRHIARGYISSFFAPRTDMQTVKHTVATDEENGVMVEQLVVKKR